MLSDLLVLLILDDLLERRQVLRCVAEPDGEPAGDRLGYTLFVMFDLQGDPCLIGTELFKRHHAGVDEAIVTLPRKAAVP